MLKQKKGIGLQNMISRTNECDGQFDVSSIMDKEVSCGYNLTEQNKYTI
jgi:signal transduction histidine kinase